MRRSGLVVQCLGMALAHVLAYPGYDFLVQLLLLRELQQDLVNLRGIQSISVGAFLCQRLEDISHRDDAGLKVELATLHFEGVATPAGGLMMKCGPPGDILEAHDLCEHLESFKRMMVYLVPLVFIEGAVLVQDFIRRLELPQIVQKTGDLNLVADFFR